MSQFYGVSPWQNGWNVSGDASGAYMTSSAHGTGWSTSWDEMMGDSARMFHKQDSTRASATTQVNGFGSDAAVAPASAATFDQPHTGFYEILPGQTWDAAQQPTMPSKSQYAPANSSPQKAIVKPSPVASAPIWVEVTSADGWTVPSAGLTVGQTPTTPTKMRPKSIESTMPPNSPPLFQPSSPNGSMQGGKRHHDIEDELGHQDRYKTELCRSWHESGACRYGSKCQFAHGTHELRPVMRHPKYKTEPCRSWVETRTCPYGRRCRFIHSDMSHSSHGSHHNGSSHHSNNGGNGQQHHAASINAHHMSHHGMNNGMSNGVHMNGMNAPNDAVIGGVRHHSASAAVGHTTSYMAPPLDRSMSMDGSAQQHMMSQQHAHMGSQGSVRSSNGAVSSPALLSSRGRVDSNGYVSAHGYQMAPHQQQSYQAQFSGPHGPSANTAANGQMINNNGNMYALGTVLPGSPPYTAAGANNFGFGMSLFSGSPPLSATSSRENLAAARASNAPWLYDTFQDDEVEDDDDFANDALPLTPLIEQLNLHAEPVSPTLSHHNPQQGHVSPIAPPTHNAPAPIGAPAASGAAPAADAAAPAATTEKGKKKKGSRLHIFQRLSSK